MLSIAKYRKTEVKLVLRHLSFGTVSRCSHIYSAGDSFLARSSFQLLNLFSFLLYFRLLRFSLTPARKIEMQPYCDEIPGW